MKIHLLTVPSVSLIEFSNRLVPVWACATGAGCPDSCTQSMQGGCIHTAPPEYDGCFCRYQGVPEAWQRMQVVTNTIVSVGVLHIISGLSVWRHRGIFARPFLGTLAVALLSLLP